MSYIVSARKYRPNRFEDVVGQQHVTTTLKNALLSDKLAHAFLFCGPRGVGKTTCARLLAKVINMPDPKTSLSDGSYADIDIDISMNIFELDAASNNGVENIRSLIEQVRFQPQNGKYKVFIIDEVHMLSQAAFNAFLKTLEEPPAHAIFILATTEKHKILPTILSRCQLYDFRRIKISDIIAQLEKIAKEEKIKVEHDALYIIAEKADGAMRDALSLFDRMSSANKESISYKSVVENLNLLDFDYYFRTVDFLLQSDSSACLTLFDQVLSNGFDGDIFIYGLAKHLRDLLYCKQEPTRQLLDLSDGLKKRYQNQADLIRFSSILNFISICNHCDINYLRAKDKRLHCELALLQMCYASSLESGEGAEKKKIELNSISQRNAQKKNDKEDNPIVSPSIDGAPKDNSAIQSGIVSDSSQPQRDDVSARREGKEKDHMKNTPSFNSLDYLMKAAETELEQSKTETALEIDYDNLMDCWNTYAQSVDSPTTRAVLEMVLIEVKAEQITILVPSSISKEEIQQETELYERLRNLFRRPELEIRVKVDREKFPEANLPKQFKLLTTKEKYDHLKDKNLLLDKLIDTLGLTLDQD